MAENLNELIDEAERLARIVALPDGDLVLCCDSCGRCWPDDHAALSESCTCSRFKQRMEWATDRDVLQDFGKVLDKLAAELAEEKQRAAAEWQRFGVAYRAWKNRAFKLGNGFILPGESDEEFEKWLEAAEYGEPADEVATLKSELATTKAELNRLRAQAERYRLDALRLAAQVDPDEFAAEWEAEIADLRTVREDLAAAKAVIAKHDLCHDLHGKVGRDEFEEGCRRETVKEFGSCGWAERIANLEADLAAAKAELAVVRSYAHKRED